VGCKYAGESLLEGRQRSQQGAVSISPGEEGSGGSSSGKAENKGRVRRYLVTRFGIVALRREKVNQGNGEGCYPLDRAIGLLPRQETTLWVKRRACELANDYTYRPATALLSAEIGDEVSHGAVWG
jgi:hypothetical protein